MDETHTSLIARDDTFLGVCEGIGEDFGFDPTYLRIVLGVGLLWNPPLVLGVYAALGVVVLASRLVFPNPRIAAAAAAAAVPAQGAEEGEREPLPLAA